MRLAFVVVIGCGAATVAPTPSNKVPVPQPSATVNVRPGAAIDPITLHMARADVHALFGPPPKSDADYDEYPDRGIELTYADDRVAAIHIYSDERGGYETVDRKAFPLVEAHGIRWGSTPAQVIAAYGTPESTGDLSGAPIPSKWINYPGIMFDFIMSNDHLFHLVVGGDSP